MCNIDSRDSSKWNSRDLEIVNHLISELRKELQKVKEENTKEKNHIRDELKYVKEELKYAKEELKILRYASRVWWS